MNYSDFQQQAISEKIGLVQLEASKRLVGFNPMLANPSIFSLSPFYFSAITDVTNNGQPLQSVQSLNELQTNTYFHDRINKILYLKTPLNIHPNGLFIGLTFQLFFSNVAVIGPYDLDQGYDVEWLPLLRSSSQFGFALDNQNQLGQAIEGSGTITFENDQEFWKPLFDKVYFENQRVFIYSWNRSLPFQEAKLIYRGRIEKRSYTFSAVQFQLKDVFKELRTQLPLQTLDDLENVRIKESSKRSLQRLLYGLVRGHRPQNIDEIGSGYPMTGTVRPINSSVEVIGIGTAFLAELFPNDQILIGDDTKAYTIASVTNNTVAILSEPYQGKTVQTPDSVSIVQIPSVPKNWQNRRFLIAGHALSQIVTTVTKSLSSSYFQVQDASDFAPGDAVFINGENATVLRVSGNFIALSNSLVLPPQAGAAVTRLAISNVKLDDKSLVYGRDYSLDPQTAILTLTKDAEFNTAQVLNLKGSLTFTQGSTAVTGTGTFFQSDIDSGDFIKSGTSLGDYSQVLSVEDDTHLTLVAAPASTFSGQSYIKKNPNYVEGQTVLSLDAYGVTDTRLSTGKPLLKASEIVKDLLSVAGIETDIDEESFAKASALSQETLGVVIPARYSDTSAPAARDVINYINQSVLGALVLNENLEFSYTIFSPAKKQSYLTLREFDILKLEVTSSSENFIKTAIVEYDNREYDPDTARESFKTVSKSSLNVEYLAGLTNEKTFTSCLTEESDAEVLVARMLFLNEIASSVLKVSTKLQTAQTQVTDSLLVEHEKLYERFGSTFNRKIAIVQSAKKSISDSTLELEDLSNAFTRCGCIAQDESQSFVNAPEGERILNGYITDDFGMQDNDPNTFGISLIW